MASLETLLADRPEDILLPNKAIQKAALNGIKEVLDPVAAEYSVLDAVHVDGLDVDQVWVQAQMVVDGAIDKLFGRLSELAGSTEPQSDDEEEEDEEDVSDASGLISNTDEEDQPQNDQIAEDDSEESDYENGELADDFDEADFVDGELDENEESPSDQESSVSLGSEEESRPKTEIEKLNSGLFELEEFQQQVLALENDTNGLNDDEDEIDYFGDVPEEESDSDAEAHYADFFAPPKKKKFSKPVRTKPREARENEEEAIEEAMENARMDLFASEEDEEDEGTGIGNGSERLSTFEKQQRDLELQIAQFEDENVGQKEWALRGEITAGQRPQDSLVHSEIDFDRNAKPAPVITSEVTQNLEDLIRDRIKKQQFDGLIRRLPPSELEHKKSRELAQVQETKSQKSLAELYEEDQQRKENPDYFAKQDSQAMDTAHKEVVDLFSVLSRKLDALCSWNYTPKAPKPSLTVVSDAAAISMEEAQPSTMATESMLAPQEVYKASASSKDEIIGANSLPIAKSELTPDERRRLRRRAKAKAAKTKESVEETSSSKPAETKKDKNAMFETLKKGNVTMLDKRGQKRDMRGNVVKEKKALTASHIKL